MTFEDVEIEDPDPTHDGPPPRRRRAVVTALLVGVPVLAVTAVLGARALSGTDVDIDAVNVRVSALAEESFEASGASTLVGGIGGPGGGTGGTAAAPPGSDTMDVTVFCSSVESRPAELVVRSAGEVVGVVTAACGDAADPDADPVMTVLPDVPVTGRWSFDLEPETTAAMAVVAG
ncbi:hypothetical protein [Cellulomonas triticagri]|uniref:Uncharacterized protein n=1 Tax=Cellulomonas triticagri TaxID=2483352 RepID=A0A3M2IYQ1_9CELL|nr:hypothetical protein [Cellulomonas triticagri]RMI04780.1 hypothetical protein EBM89_17675 [Cellulomonas triticagri]